MVHIAMQQNDESGSPVDWGEHVTDQQYSAAADAIGPPHTLTPEPPNGLGDPAAVRPSGAFARPPERGRSERPSG
jgi:hypothetical protein